MFHFTTAGESHGRALVAIVEGLPAGLPIDSEQINHELWRRQQGYGRGARMKIEQDRVEILSGLRHGQALGSPVALMIENKDWENWQEVMAGEARDLPPEKSRRVKRPRPGHADLAGGLKYDARDLRNVLERASARETAARVACGALAKQLLAAFGVEIRSHVIQLGGVPDKPLNLTFDQIAAIPDDAPLNCADKDAQQKMIELIDQKKSEGDTLGGIFEVVARGVIPGLGSHTSWDQKLDGRLAQAIMSIHAVKAVAIGAGFEASSLPGSEVHDEISYDDEAKQFTRGTNRAGGLEGGVTNGEDIRVTLGDTSDPVSADKLYQREERPMGILRWDIDAPGNAAGENARLIKYHYKVEYDRQYVVSLPEAKQTLQEEFERLQRDRQKR